jgi:Cu/Ag efflux protein CusF
MKHSLMIFLLAAVGAGPALAQHAAGSPHTQLAQASAGQKTGKGTGLIQQVDRDKGTLTIKHGPLQGLDMPAMTMSFQVKDKAMLSNLQPLQKVDFELTYDGKTFLITRIK